MIERPPTPPLILRARLNELEGCWLEIHCGQCATINLYPLKLLAQRCGRHLPLGAVVRRFVCKHCRSAPAEIHLNETHNREHCHGGSPGWSVQLWPAF